MLEALHRWIIRMPEQASEWAARVDWLNNFITYVAIFCTLAITGVMLYFMIKYRRRSEDQPTTYITHNATLETVWTVVPTLVCIFVFIYGFLYYEEMRTPPTNAIEVGVEGYQWGWNFEYSTGKRSSAELVIPLGKPVRLIMRSKDVNHSFFIPSMRVKEDVLASTYSYLWFTPTKAGEYPIFCTEYCGTQHSAMLATLKVVQPEVYEDFINDRAQEKLTPVELGKKLFSQKGCVACHSIDGSAKVCPTLQKLFGQEREFVDGSKTKADENYFESSMLNPNGQIVKGFQPNMMPSFKGQLSDEELAGLIAYLKTL